MYFNLEDVSNRTFTDSMHFSNFMKYLYRADKAQKNTCAETAWNMHYKIRDKFPELSSDVPTELEDLKIRQQRCLENTKALKGKAFHQLGNMLVYITLEESDFDEHDNVDVNAVRQTCHKFAETLLTSTFANIKVSRVVFHLDQGLPHCHFVYCRK